MRSLPKPLPSHGILVLLALRHATRPILAGLLAPLALRGPVRVLDGGNLFPAYTLARLVRRHTSSLDTALQHISLARAFTCHQMLALLAQIPSSDTPTLIPGLLTTFYDDSASLAERRALLHKTLSHLQRLSRSAPVVAFVSPPPPGPSQTLLPPLLRLAEQVWSVEEAPPPTPLQPRLF